MIEYVLPHNPDDRVLKRASEFLSQGKLICFPTDTNWILAACSTNKNGIEKLYKIKHENKDKHFAILCSDISMASEIALINTSAFRALKKCVPGHYTFIFEATKKIAKYVQASKIDKEVGVRFVPSKLVTKLIEYHGEPLVSTNIPASLLGTNDLINEPIYSYQLEDKLLGIAEMIIDPGEFEFSGLSTVISFTSGQPELIREGAGDLTPFR